MKYGSIPRITGRVYPMISIGNTYCNVPGKSEIDFTICEIIRNKVEIKSGKWIHNVEIMQKRNHDLITGIIQPRFMISIINNELNMACTVRTKIASAKVTSSGHNAAGAPLTRTKINPVSVGTKHMRNQKWRSPKMAKTKRGKNDDSHDNMDDTTTTTVVSTYYSYVFIVPGF